MRCKLRAMELILSPGTAPGPESVECYPRYNRMAYSEILAGRVTEALRKVKKVRTRKMMGGL